MPTDKKRVIIYLDEADKQRLDKVAHDLGSSVSRLCGDVLMQSMGQLEITAQAIKLSRTDPEKAVELMKQAVKSAQGDLLKEMETL